MKMKIIKLNFIERERDHLPANYTSRSHHLSLPQLKKEVTLTQLVTTYIMHFKGIVHPKIKMQPVIHRHVITKPI